MNEHIVFFLENMWFFPAILKFKKRRVHSLQTIAIASEVFGPTKQGFLAMIEESISNSDHFFEQWIRFVLAPKNGYLQISTVLNNQCFAGWIHGYTDSLIHEWFIHWNSTCVLKGLDWGVTQIPKVGKTPFRQCGLVLETYDGHTTLKINMEPTNHTFRKENDLPNLHDYVPC